MIIFHRITCLTAFILLCYLLTLNFTLAPLPSEGLFTLLFLKLASALPYEFILIFVCLILIILIYSTFTLQLQDTAFVIFYNNNRT